MEHMMLALPIPTTDISESLGRKTGDRMEVLWEVEEDNAAVVHWWGCTLLPKSKSSKGRKKTTAIRTIQYDPYPKGGYHTHTRERIIFLNQQYLRDVSSGKQLYYRAEGSILMEQPPFGEELATVTAVTPAEDDNAKRQSEIEISSSSNKKAKCMDLISSINAHETVAKVRAHSWIPGSVSATSQQQDEVHPMTKGEWWTVNLRSGNKKGATRLVSRCMRIFGWDESCALDVLDAYRQFVWLVTDREDWFTRRSIPCKQVEQMWKQHILDTANYRMDCILLCGHMVDFNPDQAAPAVSRMRDDTHTALRSHFKSQFNESLWIRGNTKVNYSSNKPPQNTEVKITGELVAGGAVGSGITKTSKTGLLQNQGKEMSNPENRSRCLEKGKLYIGVRISGKITWFIYKKDKAMGRLMDVVALRHGLDGQKLQFVHKSGKIIRGSSTPTNLEMSDSDIIDCVKEESRCSDIRVT